MDFTNIGTVSGFVKAMESKRRTEMRTSEMSSEKPTNIDEWIKQQNEQFKSSADRQELSYGNTSDQKLVGIQTKYYSGGNLTRTEREYLKSKNPALYERLLASESLKKSYRSELKRCRTREEVHRLKMSHTVGTMGSVKSDTTGAATKMNDIQSSTNEFVKSGEYHALPTEHEKAIAEKRVKQAEERQRRKHSEGTALNRSGKSDADKDSKLFRDIRPGETVEQAKNSPEMLKVRRAKAKRAYSASSGEFKVVISEKA